tara:strand:+ start:1260 stop:1886 length:627 start_codon:yes stop_codon:yes gene_type:complete
MKFRLKEIESISTKQYKGIVHDLTVEKDHSYNVQGTVVHNSICSTRIQTGHGMPTLASVIECVRVKEDFPNVKIIADGGVKSSGDMVKALAAGADFVMAGSLLAGTAESPGEVIYKDNKRLKTYRGMASKSAQMDWRGRASSLEGVTTFIPYKGHVASVLESLEKGIRSGLSYSGVRNLVELQSEAQFVRQTSAGLAESNTHILWRYE